MKQTKKFRKQENTKTKTKKRKHIRGTQSKVFKFSSVYLLMVFKVAVKYMFFNFYQGERINQASFLTGDRCAKAL